MKKMEVLAGRRLKQFPVAILAVLLGAFLAPPLCGQDLPNLPPLTAQDPSLEDIPSVPGVPAAILYYAVVTDNTKSSETRPVRLKIFREEGRSRANVEIPYIGKESTPIPNKSDQKAAYYEFSVSSDGRTLHI